MHEQPDIVDEGPELEALTRNVQSAFLEIVEGVPYLPEELQIAVANVDDPVALGNIIAGSLRIKTEEKQELLGGARRRQAAAAPLRAARARA